MPNRSPNPTRRGIRILTGAAFATALCLGAAPALAQEAAGKRPLTHDDYDAFPRIGSTSYSADGTWMAYSLGPRRGDSTLHIRQVDGDKAYEFARGQRVQFTHDGNFAIFKVAKSSEEEHRRKLEKLHEKKEEKKEGEEEEEGGELPPDVLEALEERGMTPSQAKRMMEARGSTIAEVRQFLGLPEPEKPAGAAEKPASPSKKKKEEDPWEKEAKALAKRIYILDLGSGEVEQIEDVKGYSLVDESSWIVMHMEAPPKDDKKKDGDDEASEGEGKESEEAGSKGPEKTEPAAEKPAATAAAKPKAEKEEPAEAKAEEGEKQDPKKDKKPKDPLEKKRKDGTDLVLRQLGGDAVHTIENVLGYGLVAEGDWLWYSVGTKKIEEGVEHGLYARNLEGQNTVKIADGYGSWSGIRTDREHKQMVFTGSPKTLGEDDRKPEVYLWDFSGTAAKVVVTDATPGVPEGFRIPSSGIGFTADGSALQFSIRPPKREDLPKILPEDEIKLDLWHYRDGYLQTMQAKQRDPRDAARTSIYFIDEDRLTVVGTEEHPSLNLITADGSRALLADSKPYEHMVQWDGRYSDYWLVNTLDGSRTAIVQGLRGRAQTSPEGRYVVWFDHRDYHWHAFDVNTQTSRNLTENVPVRFDREIDDRPEPHRAHGMAGWTEDAAEMLLHDAYDLWAISPATGAFRCVTDGLGRAEKIRFRLAGLDLRPDAEREEVEDAEKNESWVKGQIVLSAFDERSYASGYYIDNIGAVQKPKRLIWGDHSYGRPTRPSDADRLFFTIQRYDQFPDLWTTDLAFGGMRRLTDACPQLDELSWGSTELVSWQSDDGTTLNGYLVKPDGFDPNKKYPMMVYFYERSSERMHRFVTPGPGTSPNAAYYVSNGYLWFVPDIVYSDGYPGESCEKCVVSGVQAVIDMGFVDKHAIGAAGHSWGGYQTAHLITRTNIFAAVESGAPVVNMFSAYGGIRWGSGMSRQFQYEQTQSRIGGSIWDKPMRYWENSPLFHLDKVETPVLILHNDQDGAVPWYQGIEFFVAMKRLGKEAYLFNYNGEDHGLRKRQNTRDWTRRMQEYFDHHLKGAPMPAWMASGVPFHERVEEKIPHAPSFREAMEAGLIGPKAEAEPAVSTEPAGAGR